LGLAMLNTMRLTYNNMHTQELGAAMDPNRPEVAAFLAQAEANAAALGAGDPSQIAVMQLTRRLQLESLVMTFNNLFLVMAICFAAMLFMVPWLKRPAGATAPQGAH